MTPVWWGVIIFGTLFLLLLLIPALKLLAPIVGSWKSSASSSTGTPSQPRNWTKWIGLVLIAAAMYWVWVWWPETAPGKAWISFIGLAPTSEWYNWAVRYPFIAVLVIMGWRVFTNKPASISSLVVVVAAILIGLALPSTWQSTTPGGVVGSIGSSSTEKEVNQRDGATRVVDIGLNDTMRLYSGQYRGPQKGHVYIGCGIVVWPTFLKGNNQAPQMQIAAVETPSGYDTVFALTQRYKTYLVSQGISRVRVEWSVALVPQDQPNCHNTRWGQEPPL